MQIKINKNISSIALAEKLSLKHCGDDTQINSITSFNVSVKKSLTYFSGDKHDGKSDGIVICKKGIFKDFIESNHPRYDFVRALNLLEELGLLSKLKKNPIIGENCKIDSSAVISPNVEIGKNTSIGKNVVVGDGVKIGSRVTIKSNSVIGEDGFGFEYGPGTIPIRFPHLGSVIIGDEVEIGSCNTINKGTLGDTIIGDYVKTDDHVHIAHNCTIGNSCIITAGVIFSGGVSLGEKVWIGPNASIMQKVSIGNNVLVGIGAVVLRDIEESVTVVGNPARKL